MFTHLETVLISLVHTLPLEAFVFIASFVEEVVAPIPSPTVMLAAGSIAQFQERALYALVPLILIGAIGKTIGALVVYAISDKAENLVMNKFGRFFGVTHADVLRLQSKLGNGIRDYVLLIVLRALPIMPSVLLSVGSGLLKVSLPLFIISTFLGTLVRDGIYLYAGYIGTEALSSFVSTSTHIESIVEIIVGALIVSGVMYFIYKKKRLLR